MTLNILFLCNKPNAGIDASTIIDHIEAFESYSGHIIWVCSIIGHLPGQVELNRFDAIIIHYSLSLLKKYYLSDRFKQFLRDYQGLKIVFIQDEYRQINNMIDELAFLKIDLLFTCFPESEMERIYPSHKLPGVSKISNLTGYIPDRLTQLTHQVPIAKRTLHVGYRTRQLGYWYGELAYEKWNIVEKWREKVTRTDIHVDISYHEKDRLYGQRWIAFLSSCKTTLGVESGASVMDFTGEIEKTIDLYQLTHPNESFYEVQRKFLLEHEGKYRLNQISPRCFEAIALKTVLVLYEGEYSGILVPGRHYIVLKKDFSNIEEVLGYLQDDVFLQEMADVAFREIALNPAYGYPAFIAKVDAAIELEFKARKKVLVTEPYTLEAFEAHLRHIAISTRCYKLGLRCYQKLPRHVQLGIKAMIRPKLVMNYAMKQFFRLVRGR